MRSIALAFFLSACAAADPRAIVTIASMPQTPQAPLEAMADCRIEGTGERYRHDKLDETPFEIFSVRHSHQPSLLIAAPDAAHVTWSEFPGVASDDRARVALGGQAHIRYAGYASLHGRTFTIKKRFTAEPNHLWARAGAPVEIVAIERGTMVARIDTPFVAPKTLAVRGACDAIAYTVDEPEDAEPTHLAVLENDVATQETIALYVSPRADKPFATIDAPDLGLDVVARSGDFTRVQATAGDVEIDAWVKSSQIAEGISAMTGVGYGSSSCGGSGGPRAMVNSDTPLYVGANPSLLEGAVVEKGAEIYVDESQPQTIKDRVIVSFTFVDRMIAAPQNSSMWIAKDAFTR